MSLASIRNARRAQSRGGNKGGKMAAANMTPEQRTARASVAARTRWAKPRNHIQYKVTRPSGEWAVCSDAIGLDHILVAIAKHDGLSSLKIEAYTVMKTPPECHIGKRWN
jgi:hypothetical protein